MRKVHITQNMVALVDDEDYEKAMLHGWQACKKGDVWYAQRKHWDKKRKKYVHMSLHRFLLGVPAHLKVDHKDRDGLNNCRSNLRICTKAQNCMNAVKPSHGHSSIYKGVVFFKRDQNWRAYIKKDGHQIHLGYFEDPVDATKAYDKKAKEIFGEFARPNLIGVAV